MRVAGVKRRERVVHHALILAGETFGDELFEFRHVEVEHPRDQAERVNVLALVLGRAADGLDGQQACNASCSVMPAATIVTTSLSD